MKHLFLKVIPVLSLVLLPAKDYAQGLQRYSNSLFADYGLLRYNNKGSEQLGEQSKLLSFGLGYHKDVTGFLALGLKGKHYEVAGPGSNTFNSNTVQVQFRLQRPRISRSFRLRRFSPYFEGGFGYANEYSNQNVEQYTAEYAYASLLAGMDYNFSDHWSLGVQGEYRLSGKDVSTVAEQWRNALNPFNTASVRLNFYFGRNRQRPAVPRIYTRRATPQPTDSMYQGAADTAPVHQDAQKLLAVPAAAAQYPQVNTVTIKDTVLMRLVNADAVKSSTGPATVAVPVAAIPHRDTLALLQKDTIARQGAAAVVKQATAGMDTTRPIVQQDTMIQTDTAALIAKMVVPPVQKKDTLLPEQPIVLRNNDTLMATDTSTRPGPENDTAILRSGSVQSVAKPDTVLRTIRDTVTLYRRDTVTLFKRDTVTQLKRDTVIMGKNTAKIMPEKEATFVPPVDSGSSNVLPGEAVKHIGTGSGNKESAVQSHMRTGNSTVDEGADQQLEQRLKQIEAENAALQNRLRESEARSGMPAQAPPAPLPVLTPAPGKNNTNLVVLPVGMGGGKKNSSGKTNKEQRQVTGRQDSILNQLSLIQAKLDRLERQSQDTTGEKANDFTQLTDTLSLPDVGADTLMKLHSGKVHPDSAKQAMDRQIRQLRMENEALQQMMGTVSDLSLDKEQDSSSQLKPAEHDVFFNVNQYKPDTLAIRQLLTFSDTLRTSGAYWILLEGFTDKSGNAAYNLQLSKKRVASVKAVLIEQGIPKEHILEKTFGSRFSTGLINSNDRKVRITQILR